MKPIIKPLGPSMTPRKKRPAPDIAAQLNVYGDLSDSKLGELELMQSEAPGCDPYNNTGSTGIKKFQWLGNSK